MSKDPLMVGYLEAWKTMSIADAVDAGYTCVPLAFGSVTGAEVSFNYPNFDGGEDGLKADIEAAHKKGAVVLLSFGGGLNQTFNPNGAAAGSVAQQMYLFARQYGFDGIDFDLEAVPADVTESYLFDVLSVLRKQPGNLIITAAPQLSQAQQNVDPVFLVNNGNETIYNKSIEAGLFDYLFVQAYNNPYPQLNGANEGSISFIGDAFDCLQTRVDPNYGVKIPENTMIVIGEPATKEAAEVAAANIFTNDQSQEAYNKVAKQYENIKGKPQFGGAMTWGANWDADNNFMWAKTIGPVI